MEKIDRLRTLKTEDIAQRRAMAAEAAAKKYPDLAPTLATAPFFVSAGGGVLFYVSATESVAVLNGVDGICLRREPTDYAAHINGGGKGAGPIVSVFEDGKFLRVVEWDGGHTAYAFSYDAKTGMRAKSCRMAYRVGKTRKGFFISIYSRRHYLLPPASRAVAEE